MSVLRVELDAHSYPIHIGAGLLGRSDLYTPHLGGGGALIVTNETVAPLYLATVRSALEPHRVASLILPDGEQWKDLETLNRVFDALIEQRFGRDATIVALGGGVIGDMAGFAAACYQRGVRYVQVPTTLLAQVDSSVGGKTAVNHPGGKNMIGAFHQPVCVIADTDTLRSLSARQLRCGLAETIKYGIIRDPEFFTWLESHAEAMLALDPQALTDAITRACENKAAVVAVDEKEHGERATLNLGHTFGHAIETGLGHGVWLHGEAVAAGMAMAADLSVRLGRLRQDALARVVTLLDRCGLPLRAPAALSVDRMLELMAVDKKVQAGRIRLVLLNGLGSACIVDDYDAAALRATLETCRDPA